MKEAWIKYHWDFHEFFYFGYEKASELEKASFVPEYEKNIFCDKANNHKSDLVFHDKWETYLKFRKYFKRDAILVSDRASFYSEDAINFFKKQSKFILKPINAATGKGIQIIEINNNENVDSILLPILLKVKSACILEELIVQSKVMADLHSHSVNTLRVPTFRFGDGDTLIFQPFLRIGQGGNVVDNAGAGGIMGLMDIETGKVYAASDERCNSYDIHPDTGHHIIGFEVPKWNEAKEFVKQLADVLPDVRYVGWDIALTDKGWVLIEGNEKGQFLWQIPTRKGFRDEFNMICKKANIKM